jgi:hypothetical protein
MQVGAVDVGKALQYKYKIIYLPKVKLKTLPFFVLFIKKFTFLLNKNDSKTIDL